MREALYTIPNVWGRNRTERFTVRLVKQDVGSRVDVHFGQEWLGYYIQYLKDHHWGEPRFVTVCYFRGQFLVAREKLLATEITNMADAPVLRAGESHWAVHILLDHYWSLTSMKEEHRRAITVPEGGLRYERADE